MEGWGNSNRMKRNEAVQREEKRGPKGSWKKAKKDGSNGA